MPNVQKDKIISPIAIDLGAENTGVYFAHYKAGSSIEDIDREGKVYVLEKDKYTLLMVGRTAARHQRRGYDRRQMVKRLFKLIWEKHFGLPWDKDLQQATSFLFNRRGFSFLTEEYSPEILSQFPEEAYEELPSELKEEVKENGKGEYDFADFLMGLSNADEEKIKRIYESINKKPIGFVKIIKDLKKYCENKLQPESKSKRKMLSKEKSEKLEEIGIHGLPIIPSDKDDINLAEISREQAERILKSSQSILTEISREQVERISKSSQSILNWDFESDKFSLENFDNPEKDEIKTHLHHLAFALYKIYDERTSGALPRGRYFEEIKKVLRENNHSHKYLKEFCRRLNEKEFEGLNSDNLTNLIGHLSNFELKPLRSYFKEVDPKKSDYWRGEESLKDIFERWIMKQWRVGEKDKDKAKNEKGDYAELKEKWKAYKRNQPGTVINFWLETNPVYTIPPYQDINNRRPPHCQSLVLNPTFLNKNYQEWKEWLKAIKKLASTKEYLELYEEELEELKSSSGNPYFSDDEDKKSDYQRSQDDLKARLLQFILDRTKDSDPLKLNQIYSYTKKYRQHQSTSEEKQQAKRHLENTISESKLPEELKASRNYRNDSIFSERTFLHLVNCYYKLRKRTRDGRLYIHPKYHFTEGRGYERTGHYDDDNCLLSYCNHKPRQNRYQMFYDIAALLQVSTQDLKKFIEDKEGETPDEKLFNWLSGIKSLKTNCVRAAKEQKERKGYLKLDVQRDHRNEGDSPSKELKDNDLHNFCKKAISKAKEVFNSIEIYQDDKQKSQIKKRLEENPVTAIYLLAQINNIVFKERSGNARTCAICSVDNAQRMQMVTDKNGSADVSVPAKASRLPAISTRVIDGAVMRMARIVGGAVAEDKWLKIKKELEQDKKVCVPIITESNQFEFEPSLRKLKNKRKEGDKDLLKKTDKIIDGKNKRIREAVNGVCPYTGNTVGDNGEIDHIIPRSSKWGTLNDEANLIYASEQGNKNKEEKEYNLTNLSVKYRKSIFEKVNGENIKEITTWIEGKLIGGGKSEDFKFGRYLNFVQLNLDERKAFRHALFLEKNHPLRNKVINAINNRNRTLVNGTQRYFAEVLANSLYKRAMRINKSHLLSFDYFGVDAWSDSGVKELRSKYEKYSNELEKYKKTKGSSQESYSHLIDAQMAFAFMVNKHKNDGSLKLKINDDIRLWPVDESVGELLDKNIFNLIKVSEEEMQYLKLERRAVYDVETHHRQLLTDNKKNQIQISYKIHKATIISERFFPLIEHQGEIKVGFSLKDAQPYKNKDFEIIKRFLQKCKSKDQSYEVWTVKKKEAQDFLMKAGFHGVNKDEKKLCERLDDLSYQTTKKKIQSALGFDDEKKSTVGDALQVWDQFIREDDFRQNFKKVGKITLPFFYEWQKFKFLLEQEPDKNKMLQEFLKSCSMFCTKRNHTYAHKKVRKKYSLPVIPKGIAGNIRLRRIAWDGDAIFQTVPQGKFAWYETGRPHTILSKNSVPKKHYKGRPTELLPMPREWKTMHAVFQDTEIKVIKVKIKYQDKSRSRVKVTVADIQGLSVPQDKDNWEGKIILHNDSFSFQDAQINPKYHHCLKSEVKWFPDPFSSTSTNFDREIRIKKTRDGWDIEFIVNKKLKSFQ